jgi:hypothetical protein
MRLKGAQFSAVDQATLRSTTDSVFWTPPTFLPLTVGGGGGLGKVVFQCGPHTTCQPHILPPPPLNSTYHLPPPPGTRLTAHPIPPTSLCHRTPLTPVTRHTPHTRWPINVIPHDRYSSSHHPCHNGHLPALFNPVSSPFPYCSPIQTLLTQRRIQFSSQSSPRHTVDRRH